MKNISKKRKIVFAVFLALTLVWMGVLFGFSESDGETSKTHSKGISEKVALTIEPDYEIPERVIKGDFMYNVITVVRKGAHMIAYALLGILTYVTAGALCLKGARVLKPAIYSVPISVLYAVSDEIHQSFVEGRMGTVTDVLIDSTGVLLGTTVAALAFLLAYRIKRKKYEWLHK